MSHTKHATTRCGWCGQKIKRGQSIKGRDRGVLVRFCPDGGCIGKARRRKSQKPATDVTRFPETHP